MHKKDKTKEQFFKELSAMSRQLIALKKSQTAHQEENEEIRQTRDTQAVLGFLLKLSLEDIPLEDLLNKALSQILSIPWLVLQSRGAIFLVDDDNPEILVMKVHNNLGTVIPKECARVPFGRCLCGRAASTRKIAFSNRLDERHETSYDGIVPHGHYCVPILYAGKTVGVINLYVREGHEQRQREEKFLTDIANTLAGIIERRNTQKQLEYALDRLRAGMGATIQGIAAISETRDPYTAGHQRRVSDLARAIATEMGLHHDTIDAIRIAGAIHDIGKISVPTEILSKPGKITEMEFGIIKLHPQTAYNILKDIDFPWPVAQVVLQHHERMDGSGYPRGLKGESILIEARIIGVADVVEAIASHRPYRPAQGIDKALAEISRNTGILYDPAVVGACAKLFAEGRYVLEPYVQYSRYMDFI